MKIFDCSLEKNVLEEALVYAEQNYPLEVCGIFLGGEENRTALKFVRLINQAGVRATHSFQVDELELIEVLKRGRGGGLRPLMFFHSHPDASSALSKQDRLDHQVAGQLLFPGVVYLVASVRHGRRGSVSAYCYSPESKENQASVDIRIPRMVEVSS